MTVNYTPLLGLAQPVTGTESGTWGDTINASLTALVESSIAGVATASVASGNWTLSTTGSGAANEQRMAILIPTGSPGVSRNIIAPSQSKIYIVINQSNASVVLKGAATTGVTIASGKTTMVAWNGSDFVELTPNTIAGILPVVSGGTGATTSTGAGSVVLSTSPTLTTPTLTTPTLITPVLGTPSSGTLSSCTADGTNAVGFKKIPQSGSDKTAPYTLTTTDVGKYIGVGASGSIIVPTSTFANGDAISIFNSTTGYIVITTSAPTAYIAGTNTVKTSVILAARGIASILFVSSTVCILTGNVS